VHGVTGTITGWIGDYGVYAVFLLSLVDAVFPAASELVMLYAGALAAGAFAGHVPTLFGVELDSTGWAYVVVSLAGALGYLIGCIIGWAIGLYGGRPLLEQRGRWLHVTPERLDRAEQWFERYDDAAVFLGRMVPVVRSFIAIPAGVMEVPFGRYTALSFLGTLPWCFGFAAAGVALGASWETFNDNFRYADYVVVGLIVLAVLLLVVRIVRRRNRRPEADSTAGRVEADG
jgi:membrane protein DedA with SNARE-associated domain